MYKRTMPIYIYRCDACKTETEEIQDMDAEPLTDCEQDGCDGTLAKQLTTANAQFRGVGWAKEGYGRVTMGKQGPLAVDVQNDMTTAAQKAAKTGGHVAGRAAVHKHLDNMQGKSTD